MTSGDPVVIVGGGLAGAAAAWALTRRRRPVLLLEQYAAGHAHGSSHGSARIVRRAYGDALYVSLTGWAFELWDAVPAPAPLLRMLGGLDLGVDRDVAGVAERLRAAGVRHEVLPAVEAAARWPGMEFAGDVLFHPQAGTLDADAAVTALLTAAAAGGAEIRHETAVTGLHVHGERARLHLFDGTELDAATVVVAAGAWAPDLLDGLVPLPPVQVTQQQVFHFPRRDPAAPAWPSVIHEGSTDEGTGLLGRFRRPVRDSRTRYHLAGGRDGGPGDDRKVGEHDPGPVVRPGHPQPTGDETRARVVEYVRRWLPGLDPTPRGETTCLYATTPSQDFVLDRVGPIVVCSPCSGHGAKFAPLVGEFVADLVTGSGAMVPDRFRLAAHAGALPGAVSL